MRDFEQRPFSEWVAPNYCWLLALKFTLDEFADKYAMKYEEDVDGRGVYHIAVMRVVSSGHWYAFLGYPDGPEDLGISVLVPEPIGTVAEAQAEVLEVLGLGDEDVSWYQSTWPAD